MKALISPQEVFTVSYIASWITTDEGLEPVYESIENCQRVAEVKADELVFAVAEPLFWVSCADNCKAETWYHKEGLFEKPSNAPRPEMPEAE
jgi:hypothetical protein